MLSPVTVGDKNPCAAGAVINKKALDSLGFYPNNRASKKALRHATGGLSGCTPFPQPLEQPSTMHFSEADHHSNQPLLVVGVGVSSGNISTLTQFCESVPPHSGLAVIVCLYEDNPPAELLRGLEDLTRGKGMLIAQDGALIEADRIYLIPPGYALRIHQHHMRLSRAKERRAQRMAIDHVLRALGDAYGAQSVGVLLAGPGRDGTVGLRALKAAGGLTVVQDPKTAGQAAMLRNAINAGVTDRVLTVEAIPAAIVEYAEHPYLNIEDASKDPQEEQLQAVEAILKQKENFHLNQYKEGTVQRRIYRRMSLTGHKSLAGYISLLEEDAEERRCLMGDLLINVTDFFRDRRAFETLEKLALDPLLQRAEEGSEIRIWVPGCASGEEAYSLAILVTEKIDRLGKDLDLKIFATDVDGEAIRIARAGIYSAEVVNELPETYIQKYFKSLEDDQFKVHSHLREKISFSTQNVCTDPPFSRLDLISCRNLLIYLRRNVQERILKSFYFALKPNGYLFLGTSENIGSQKDRFKQLSQKWRLFERYDNGNARYLVPPRPSAPAVSQYKKDERDKHKKIHAVDFASVARDVLLRNVPPSVVIGADNRVLYVHGDLRNVIRVPEGEPQLDLFRMLDKNLRSRLRSGFFKARQTKSPVVLRSPATFGDDVQHNPSLQITISPVAYSELHDDALIVTFVQMQTDNIDIPHRGTTVAASDQEKMIEAMERELNDTRRELQNTVEELETSTEELRAAHEEALSTNEELQSANEELEASTEELRSLNEELSTVNDQLKEKIDEVQVAHNDLENFMASTNLATIFLDSQLHIKRYTPAAERLLRMGPGDLDRPVTEISRPLIDEDTVEHARRVLEIIEPVEHEIAVENGRWFVRKILPYRTEDRRIIGVVMTFSEITALKQAVRNLETREHQHAILAKLGLDALSMADIDELIDQIVREVAHTLDADFCKVLEYDAKQGDFLLRAGLGWRGVEMGVTRVPGDLDSQAGYTMKEHQAVIVADLRTEKRFRGPALLSRHGVISGVGCLIPGADGPYGVISVHTRSARNFTKDDANFLASIGNLLSVAISRRETQRILQESEERLSMARASAGIGIHDYDIKNNIIHWDQKVRDIWGVSDSSEPITYAIFIDGVHPEDREKVQRAIDEALENRTNGQMKTEYRVINRMNHKVHWVEVTGKVVFRNGEAIRMVGTVQDISKRKRMEIELLESAQKLRIAKDSNKFGAFVYFIKTGELEWDPILMDIWGFDAGEAVTLDMFYAQLYPDDVATTQAAITKSLMVEGDGHYYTVYRVINRKTRMLSWIEASGQVVFEDNQPVKMIGMIIDISERKKLEESLQAAVGKLAQDNIKKNEFIATLGHELRNPLAAINSGIQMIQLGTKDKAWALEMMANNVRLIRSLLDDLLDLTRITLGKIYLKKEFINISKLLRESLESFASKAAEKDQAFTYDLTEEPLYVYGDGTRLEQVFANILTNAHKFTPKGGSIQVKVERSDKNLLIEVQDNGIGIPPDKIQAVFDPFEQVAPSMPGNTGLGIGLSLVKQFIAMHDGSVRVTSDGPGQGCKFILSLPLSTDHFQPVSRQPTAQAKKIRDELRVLIVDDNEDAALGLAAMLESQGCHIDTAFTADAALKKIDVFQPEALILDIGLPDMSGYELLRKIKHVYSRNATYIALSGYSRSVLSGESPKSTFHHHLTKPADFKDLVEILSDIPAEQTASNK